MDDGFELAPRGFVSEDNRTQCFPVHCAVAADDIGAEPRGDGGCRFRPGRGHAVCEMIGDKTRNAGAEKPIEHIALPRPRSARQRDLEHSVSALPALPALPILSVLPLLAPPLAYSSAGAQWSADPRRLARASARPQPRRHLDER